jgi:hypothetical protein
MLRANPNAGGCARSGWGCAVRCVAPTSALDVVAVGLADGRALLYNLRCGTPSVACPASRCWRVSACPFGSLPLTSQHGRRRRWRRYRYDKLVASFIHDAAGGAVTSVAVRAGAGVPLLAVGGVSGTVTLWHLERRALHAIVKVRRARLPVCLCGCDCDRGGFWLLGTAHTALRWDEANRGVW